MCVIFRFSLPYLDFHGLKWSQILKNTLNQLGKDACRVRLAPTTAVADPRKKRSDIKNIL